MMHSSNRMVPRMCHPSTPSTAPVQPSTLSLIPLAKVFKTVMHSKSPSFLSK